MKVYYAHPCFYRSDIHDEIPIEAVEIPVDLYNDLMHQQSTAEGAEICKGGDGLPHIVVAPIKPKEPKVDPVMELFDILLVKGVLKKSDLSAEVNAAIDKIKLK